MSHRNQFPEPDEQQVQRVDPKTISQFVANQAKQLEIEALKLKLREKELEHNLHLASQSMNVQATLLKDAPAQHRKTVTTYALVAGGILAVLLVFIGFCLLTNHENFVLQFLKFVGYLVTTVFGYFAGLQRGKRLGGEAGKKDVIEDTAVMED